jgi:hypothetical protein
MSDQQRTFTFYATYGASERAPITITVNNSTELPLTEIVKLAAKELGVDVRSTASVVGREGAATVRDGDEVAFSRTQGTKG